MEDYYHTLAPDPNRPYNAARIYVMDAPFHIDKDYLYYIPEELRDSVKVGSFVIVPFGGGNRKQFGLVFDIVNTVNTDEFTRIKPIVSLLYEDLVLDSELLQLCAYLRETTLCTMGEAARTILPSAALGHINEYYSICAEITPELVKSNTQAAIVYNHIRKLRRATLQRLRIDLQTEPSKALKALLEAELIKRELVYNEPGGRVYSEKCFVTDIDEANKQLDSKAFSRSRKQEAVLRTVIDNPGIEIYELVASLAGNTRDAVDKLVSKGLIRVETTELYRDPFREKNTDKVDDNILSEAQTAAYEQLTGLYDSGEAKAALLHGVTGSGKTRVIKALCDHVIESGRAVIMLIPEIALTPQTVGYFRACYGDRIAVMHSSLSQGEKLDMWNRIRRGEVDICIGTRSAVFAPFSNLGLIILDEEQEHTYKSDSNPKYHARDIARFRCAKNNAIMLLASATPSVESYNKAVSGIYTLIELTERYGGAILPDVIICDMRGETFEANLSAIGSRLKEEIEFNLNNGEQSILFLNRRGYNNFVTCVKCGNVIMCPHCSVSLTRHNSKNGSYLSCHYCGYRRDVPEVCPSCGSDHLSFMGYGTQKVEEQLKELFPQSRILRLDADTTTTKSAYDDILGKFRAGEADILIGTQMVTKGHDFPNVTLSAVLSADAALYLDDYHANERTFSMICQLIGRAGRGHKKGRALIQTYNPEHPVITMAAAQDYKSFFANEISMRRALVFPPFCDIVLLTLISSDECVVSKAAVSLEEYIKATAIEFYPDIPYEMYGPFEAPVYRLNEKYRMRIVMKMRINKRSRAFIRSFDRDLTSQIYRNCTLSVDINPNSL